MSRLLSRLLGVLLCVAVGFGIAWKWFPRVVVQPITKIVEVGKTVVEKVKVKGPIRYVTRTVTRTEDHYIFVTKPVELPPAELDQARKDALRRFVLSMEIPAKQLISCPTPALAEGGMYCEQAISFQAEILEPKAGVFVPLVLPGELARPTGLRVEARVEATKPIQEATHLFIYPIAFSSYPSLHLVSGVSYQNAAFSGQYQVRIEDNYPGVSFFVGWGLAW